MKNSLTKEKKRSRRVGLRALVLATRISWEMEMFALLPCLYFAHVPFLPVFISSYHSQLRYLKYSYYLSLTSIFHS